MALKDLANTSFPSNFIILVNLFSHYGESTLGPKPTGYPTKKVTRQDITTWQDVIPNRVSNNSWNNAGVALVGFWRQNIVPINPTANINQGTFNKVYQDDATFNNYFFILRTQLLGALNGSANDPLIKQMDAVWTKISAVKLQWIVVSREERYRGR